MVVLSRSRVVSSGSVVCYSGSYVQLRGGDQWTSRIGRAEDNLTTLVTTTAVGSRVKPLLVSLRDLDILRSFALIPESQPSTSGTHLLILILVSQSDRSRLVVPASLR